MSPGWLDGYGGAPRAPRPVTPKAEQTPAPKPSTAKSGPLPTWKPGQVRVVAERPCCPHCGSTRVRIRSPCGETLVRMECKACNGKAWKDQRPDDYG